MLRREWLVGSVIAALGLLIALPGQAGTITKRTFPSETLGRDYAKGYPRGVSVPDYRRISITSRGTFSGPFGSGINNAPLPSYLIEKYAGPQWVNHE